MTSIGLIGYGGIAQDVVAALREADGGTKIAGVLCRPGRAAKARAALGDIAVVETLADLAGAASGHRRRSRRTAGGGRTWSGRVAVAASISW